MAILRDYLESDLTTFLSLNEFAETHKIDGRDLLVTVDNDRLQHRSKKEYDGITVGEVLFFVKKADYGGRPEVGAPIVFDGRQMTVFDSREDIGLYEIILSQNRGV